MSVTLDRRQFLLTSASAGLALLTSDAEAWAETNDSSKGKSKAKRYRLPTPGSDIDTGAAVILVDAPLDQVLKVVQDYRHYRKILPRLEQSRIVGAKKGRTDVYMRVPIMNGAYSVWGIARFTDPKPHRDDGKIVVAKMVKGNVDSWHGAWKLEPRNERQTVLRMEMFVDLKVPVPNDWVTPKLMWATDRSVSRVRDLAEKRAKRG